MRLEAHPPYYFLCWLQCWCCEYVGGVAILLSHYLDVGKSTLKCFRLFVGHDAIYCEVVDFYVVQPCGEGYFAVECQLQVDEVHEQEARHNPCTW